MYINPSSTYHHENKNLKLTTENSFNNYPVLNHRGPLVSSYLDRIQTVIHKFIREYPRALAIRVDLHFPMSCEPQSEGVIQRFIDSLKAKIKAAQAKAKSDGKRVHQTKIGYIWVKEFGKEGRPHYHLLLMFNHDAYYCLGQFTDHADNLYGRIVGAWTSALAITETEAAKGIHIPQHAVYRLRGEECGAVVNDLMRRVSYFAKVDTKQYGNRQRNFGASQAGLAG